MSNIGVQGHTGQRRVVSSLRVKGQTLEEKLIDQALSRRASPWRRRVTSGSNRLRQHVRPLPWKQKGVHLSP